MISKLLRSVLAAGLLLGTIAAGSPPAQPAATPAPVNVTLNVYAAASLTAAFSEIGERFEAYNPGVNVVFNFAGSQLLSQQIVEGAPADVFASANTAQMNVAAGSGRMGVAQNFVYNRLVVIVPKSNPAGITELQDLANPGVKVVLAAAAVPVGTYALDFLTKASADPGFSPTYKDEVLANVVSYEDNVKAVFSKVALGEADAGIVYTTDAAGPDAAKVTKFTIPDALNTIANYPIAYVTDSANPYWARGFVRFVLSRDGQRILQRYGFIAGAPTTRR
jgi:molybdate transport system substrate-binding protein